MNRADAALRLRGWLALQLGVGHPVLADDDTELIGTGVLDSFALLSLTALVEEMLGRALGTEEAAQVENFKSVNAILTRFFTH